jgi:hypothetical protein
LRPQAGQSNIQLALDDELSSAPIDSVSLSLSDGVVSSKRVNRENGGTAVSWKIETDGSPACLVFDLASPQGTALAVKHLRSI